MSAHNFRYLTVFKSEQQGVFSDCVFSFNDAEAPTPHKMCRKEFVCPNNRECELYFRRVSVTGLKNVLPLKPFHCFLSSAFPCSLLSSTFTRRLFSVKRKRQNVINSPKKSTTERDNVLLFNLASFRLLFWQQFPEMVLLEALRLFKSSSLLETVQNAQIEIDTSFKHPGNGSFLKRYLATWK